MTKNNSSPPKSILILVVILFSLVAMLNVAGYLFFVKKYSPVAVQPTATLTPEPTVISTSNPSPTPENVNLGEYTTKELLGENTNYSVYLFDRAEDFPGRKGKIAVYDKNKKVAIHIEGLFSIFGATIVTNDDKGEYIALSNGTSSWRNIIIISLTDKKQIIDNFCSGSKIFFWEKYTVYANCDSFENRPWGDGEARSIEMTNLTNGKVKVLFKSDLLRDFGIDKIEGNTLFYTEYSVKKETDWNNQDAQKIEAKIYNWTAPN